MTLLELTLETAINEAGEFKDVRLSKEDAACILALLKEQEPVEPKRIDGKRNHFIKCGNCNYDLVTGFQFCPHCGKELKWE